MKRNSLPVSALAEVDVLRRALAALCRKLDGWAAAARTARRKRAAFTEVPNTAVEKGHFAENPLNGLRWNAPAVNEEVDPAAVPNPAQVARLLAAVAQQRGRGPHLEAFFGCMYYAAMRPAEVIHLRLDQCHLPKTGWGLLNMSGGVVTGASYAFRRRPAGLASLVLLGADSPEGESVRIPRWLRPTAKRALPAARPEPEPEHEPARDVVVGVVLALVTPMSAAAIAAAIDVERGLAPDAPASCRTSTDAVRKVLRQMAAEGRVTGMRPVEWYHHRVPVPGRWGGADWWWPTHKWEQIQNARSQPRPSGWYPKAEDSQRKQPPQKSEVAKAVDRVIAANEAHYQAHKNDFGPSAP
ncbi:hypothetical protein [Streptomyces sp. NPDC059928]|uniref:hypothetical protein n=1 Tax=Streptomyces sp. NPDC059928 TaxID=3347007 RepID=UPI00365CA035